MGWGVTARNRLHLGTSGKATPKGHGGPCPVPSSKGFDSKAMERKRGGRFWQEEPGEEGQEGAAGMLQLSSL